jgi:hypothetical protein
MAEDIERAIFKLKTGEAPDHLGLAAEHLKHGGNAVINYITDILNNHSSQLRLIPYLHHTSSVLLSEIFNEGGIQIISLSNIRPIIIYFHSSQCRLIPYLHQRPIFFKTNSSRLLSPF